MPAGYLSHFLYWKRSIKNYCKYAETIMFHLDTAEVYVPDGLAVAQALSRTTHLCLAAHPDDIEIMAPSAILACFQQPDQWFTGVVVSDGRGAPRDGIYKDYDDEEMRRVRFKEQRKAAIVGEYAAQIMLDYPSKTIQDATARDPVGDILKILMTTGPKEIYTHNLVDKHDTHVAVVLRVIAAIRQMPPDIRPEKLYGCEVWRDLDWLVDEDKVAFDTSQHESLQAALIGVFDSQIAGGKRYDLATMARRKVNATYLQPHEVDTSLGIAYGMDLTPLVADPDLNPAEYIEQFVQRFAADIAARFERVGG
jgi:LmbE family N-acetylglucosaminyl deacetylase